MSHRFPPSVSRRRFLIGAGGATCALPFLESLGGAQTVIPPRRLVLIYNPNGTYPEQWFPSDVRSETDFDLNLIHEPLAPYRELLTVIQGVDAAVAQAPENNGGPHQRGIGALFTGQALQIGDFTDGCGSRAGWANGPSVDQLVARQIGADTPLRSLELGVRCFENDVQSRIAYAGPGAPLPPISDPRLAYDRLFGRTAVDPTDPASRRTAVFEAVFDQFTALRARVSQADREKLDAHLTLMQDLEARLDVGRGEPNPACEAPATPVGLNPDSETDMPAVSRAQLDLLALSFACDLTRVASVQYSTGFNRIRYPWLDDAGEGHSLSHQGDSNLTAWNALGARAQWHASEVAYLVQKLSEIPEGDGTVMDNTLILWGNEVSKGNTHALTNLPYLLIGKLGGAVRGGTCLTFNGASNADLLLTVLQAYGSDATTFGHLDYSTGPLSGILT